jgi:outer membrane beta-barrel protein
MRRSGLRTRTLVLCASLVAMAGSAAAEEPTPPGQEPTPPAGSEPTPPAGSEPTPPAGSEPTPPSATEPTIPGGEPAPVEKPPSGAPLGALSWKDILTVPRRPILKYHRVELIPTYNLSINNTLYRHHGFGGIINFFLSETLNIGLEGTYYIPQQLEHYFLRGLDDRVLPSVNQYRWSATFNFGYVPIYGKFALFNKWIFQWEAYVQAGIGVLQTEWITRDPANRSDTNYDVLWHVDLGTRLFLTKWLAIHAYIKDYMFVDKFEPASRTNPQAVPEGVSDFVQNIVFGVGVGMFLPTGFEYKYTR